MSVTVASNRFINFSSKPIYLGFYQQLLGRLSSFQELGSRLVIEAEVGQAQRRINRVEEIGLVLSNLPLKEYRTVGQYYLGWCAYRHGVDVQNIFEKILETSQAYKTKALWSLAAIASDKGNYEAELKYLTDSLRFASGLAAHIELAKGIAVVKAKEGYHPQALKDLESLVPFLRFAKPHTYYDCLNSLAVELGEVGRIEEATNVCKIVLASPFAFAYPEWRETSNEIALKAYRSRSVVSAIKPVSENVVPLPVAESSPVPTQGKPARILSYARFIKKMVKKPNGDENIPPDATEKDLYLRLMELIAQKDLSIKELRKVINFVENISSEPDKD